MKRLRPCRWLPLLRVLVLGLFVLGMVLQPVLAATAEMHELEHDPSGTHGHVLQAGNVDVELAAAGQREDGGQTLHVLLDFAHCCGASVSMVTPLNLIPVTPVADRLSIAQAPILPDTRLVSPFKPPIFR